MSADVIVSLVGVTKEYAKSPAVDNVSLDVHQGEFVTLLGPSGCGKTTTLRLIAGFIKPDRGQILIKGEDVGQKAPYERNLGMVFQSYALFPHMTVYENVAFGLKMRKVAKEDIQKMVSSTLEIVRLSGYEKRYPREMSGGEQQRVALARAVVTRPDVLLLDEPLSNLDFKLRQQMRLEMKSIQKKLGPTAIYVTHDQGEALTMSDRVVVMQKGRIVQVGTPTEIYEFPTNKFVADFIGEANFFEGRIGAIEREVSVSTNEGLTFYASLTENEGTDIKHDLKPGARVVVAVRPSKVQIGRRRTRQMNSFPGRVEDIEYIGSNMKYHVVLTETGSRLTVDRQSVGIPLRIGIGEDVYVEWEPVDLRVLWQD